MALNTTLNINNTTTKTKVIYQIIYTVLCFLSILIYASSSSAESTLNSSRTGNGFPTFGEQPQFLPVDKAFTLTVSQAKTGIKLHAKITKGYYLYKARFEFSSPQARFGKISYSKPGQEKDDPAFGLVTVFYDEVTADIPIELPSNTQEAEIIITYQGCADGGLCYPPKTINSLYLANSNDNNPSAHQTLTTENTIQNNKTANHNNPTGTLSIGSLFSQSSSGLSAFLNQASLPMVLLGFFLLGLALTFTPCVFPMMPIISSIVIGQKHPTPARSLMLCLSYVLGMAITFAIAGVITGILGAEANLQAHLQSPVVLISFAVVFVVLSLAMFGVYELQLPAFLRNKLAASSQNMTGGKLASVFVIGMLSALVVSPCVSAPVAGALIYISTTGDAVVGGLTLFSLGLGMGVPLIVVGMGGRHLMPKAGNWMNVVKAIFGIMLIGVAIWLVERLLPNAVSLLAWGLLAIFSGIYLTGLLSSHSLLTPKRGVYALITTLGMMLLALSITTALHTSALPFKQVYSLAELDQELAYAVSNNKPVMLDYYADWCASCKVMEREVFSQPEAVEQLSGYHFIQADVTATDAKTQALLTRYGLFGPPSILFFTAEGTELKNNRIVGEANLAQFMAHIKSLNN